jgi:hypothetical protein
MLPVVARPEVADSGPSRDHPRHPGGGIALVAALDHGDTTTAPGAWLLIAIVLGTLLDG